MARYWHRWGQDTQTPTTMKTYATIAGIDALYTFQGTPDERYGVRTSGGGKYLWSADGSKTATHHRNVRYYADVTGMSYADARAACEAARAEMEGAEREHSIEREERDQERLADMHAERKGEYVVEVPGLRVLSSGREALATYTVTVDASSKAMAAAKAMDLCPPDIIMPDLHRCIVEFLR